MKLEKSRSVDLRHFAAGTNIEPGGLASLVRQVINRKLDKDWRVQCSNWLAAELSQEQIIYAADDAVCALQIMAKLMESHHNHDMVIQNCANKVFKNKKSKTEKQSKPEKQKKSVPTQRSGKNDS